MSTLQGDIRIAVEHVVGDHFNRKLQTVYADLQGELGIAGDIAPWEVDPIEQAERLLGCLVAKWLVGGLSFDQAEALGMDGTRRETNV